MLHATQAAALVELCLAMGREAVEPRAPFSMDKRCKTVPVDSSC
jgi:hypothetical protein